MGDVSIVGALKVFYALSGVFQCLQGIFLGFFLANRTTIFTPGYRLIGVEAFGDVEPQVLARSRVWKVGALSEKSTE